MGCGAQGSWKLAAEREHYDTQIKDTTEKLSRREQEHMAEVTKLSTENALLKEVIKQLRDDLTEESELWRQERAKNVSMTFDHLPLCILERLAGATAMRKDVSSAALLKHMPALNKTYPNAVIACCNVAGFHQLISSMTAAEAIDLTDRLHILVDRAFGSSSSHVVDSSCDCYTIVSSLSHEDDPQGSPPQQVPSRHAETPHGDRSTSRGRTPDGDLCSRDEDQLLPGAVDDSDVGHDSTGRLHSTGKEGQTMSHSNTHHPEGLYATPQACAMSMAKSSLKLMASSVGLQIPGKATNNQIQIRIALHAGAIHLGVTGTMQHSSGLPPDQLAHSIPVPRVNVLGRTYSEALELRDTSLALQIRVSQAFRKLLLTSESDCILEQCPDFHSSGRPDGDALKHTYWLVGMNSMDLSLPPLDRAISLGGYDGP